MQKLLKVVIGALFITGLGLVGYSIYNIWHGHNEVEQRKAEAKQIIEQANNDELDFPVVTKDTTAEELVEFNGETIGLLYVPKLDKELPIVEGTEDDDLEVGVGHYTGTALPMQNEQIVLSGHRDTVFRNFDQLEIGDTFVVKLPYGTFEYKITETEIVDADDRTVIRPRGEEILTVTTCYPFSYLGNAPDRFIFYAKPVEQSDSSDQT